MSRPRHRSSTRSVVLPLALVVLLLGLALALPAAALAAVGWSLQSSAVLANANLTGVAFATSSDGWAVGWNEDTFAPVILTTTNGGTNWRAQSSGTPTSALLLGVAFTNVSHAWAVGDAAGNGLILATTDGGISWNTQYSASASEAQDTSLNGVAFANASDGWAVGSNSAALVFVGDGPRGSAPSSGAWLNPRDSRVMGDEPDYYTGVILATTDGGAGWSPQSLGTSADTQLNGVAFANASDGWAVGSKTDSEGEDIGGVILATTDGGATWNTQYADTTDLALTGVAFTNASDGWAVGEPGTILVTTDGGTIWNKQSSGPLANASPGVVAFANPSDGWAAGYSGTILATTDAGSTWSSQSSPAIANTYLNSVAFANASDGWAAGYAYDEASATYSSVIVATTNGGWPAPTLVSFSPAFGLVGASVTLTGTGLAGASKVAFNGVSASFKVVGDTQITATVPNGATSGRITVTTPGGVATSVTSFTVSVLSGDDTLKSLTVSEGTLSPAFASSTLTYTDSVANGVAAIAVTPTANDGEASCVLQVGGTTVTNPIALKVGATVIGVVVTAQSGAQRTYSLTVTRAAASSDDSLKSLAVSAGTLRPAFSPATLNYTDSVANSVSAITVTPTTNDVNASCVLQVYGSTVSNPIALYAGFNVIDVVVTAQSGAQRTYSLTVTWVSGDDTLYSLTVSAGTLKPAFSPATVRYTDSVANGVAAITVTPTANDGEASCVLQVGGTTVTNPIALKVGATVIGVVVTAADGAKQTYSVTVTRAGSLITPTLTLKLSGLKSGALKLGKRLTAKGTVTPSSLAGEKVTVTVQRKADGKWRKVRTTTATVDASGSYSCTCKPAKTGRYRIRATIAKTATNTAGATAWKTFRVK